MDRLQGLRDLLANLQLLEMSVNISKSATVPATWAASLYPTPDQYTAYLERNEIPWLPMSPDEFSGFFIDRRKALALRILRLFGVDAAPDNENVSLPASVPEKIDDELAVTGDA
ncbi:hypothetical protein [Paenarthrobacter aurescens]|uniref:hypothetical protein n=1 Tax=Paenarthrobacter aurescens TaxID=43663 RepID=UPI003F74ECBF